MGEMVQFKRPDGRTCPGYLASPKAGAGAPTASPRLATGRLCRTSTAASSPKRLMKPAT